MYASKDALIDLNRHFGRGSRDAENTAIVVFSGVFEVIEKEQNKLQRRTPSFTRFGNLSHVQSLDLAHTAPTVSRERVALSVAGLGFGK